MIIRNTILVGRELHGYRYRVVAMTGCNDRLPYEPFSDHNTNFRHHLENVCMP